MPKRPPRAPSRAPRKKTVRKQKAQSSGLEPAACLDGAESLEPALASRIEAEGGCIVGRYHDPYGGRSLILCVLPIGKIEPTPFQRDLSETHHKRLADVIHKTGRFLDPVIAITAPKAGDGFWTPNGRHRLEAMRRRGAKAITALVVADREVA